MDTTENSKYYVEALHESLSGNVYEIRVDATNGTRTGSTTVALHILASSPPILSVYAPSSKIPSSGSLQLLGSLDWSDVNISSMPYTTSWIVDDPSVNNNLVTIAKTPMSSDFNYPEDAVRSANLLIPAFDIRPYITRSSLVFTLSCTFSSGLETWALISLDANIPPSPGVFDVNPTAGTELLTLFAMNAHSWNDLNLPLTYEYRYLLRVSSDGSSGSIIKLRSSNVYYSSILPAAADSGGNLTLRLLVYDDLDAFAISDKSITFTNDVNASSTATTI